MACIAAICMAFFYQTTAVIGGQQHSVALLGISFFLALIGWTSSVLFMPYMGRFREIYLVTYMVGEGLSGFYTSILSLIQEWNSGRRQICGAARLCQNGSCLCRTIQIFNAFNGSSFVNWKRNFSRNSIVFVHPVRTTSISFERNA